MSELGALAHPSIFPWLCLIIGLVVGSFLNVVIHRLPAMMERDWQEQCAELRGEAKPASEPFDLVRPRSRCPACGHEISALENIPLVSFAVLRGRCSACAAPIGMSYPVIEALAGVAALYCASRYGFGPAAFGSMLFTWALIAAATIDLNTQLLPDAITLPLLWAGIMINIPGTFIDLRSAVIGAVAGYLFLWSVYWLFKIATGKEGMGFGDFKLLAAIGAWTGWQVLPLVVLLSSFIGAVAGIALMVLAQRGRSVPIPFGPYLAAAGVVALFWGPQVTHYYLTKVL